MNYLKSFVIPTRYPKTFFDVEKARVSAIIPTYKPGPITERLVRELVRWNPRVRVYVVDDSTPRGYAESDGVFEAIAAIPRVVLLRTPENTLKAGALNYALKHIYEEKEQPDVIITLDDDVVINDSTLRALVAELMSYEHLGAACSQCHVLNKNKNLLTRLQSLEYLGFNATRLADEGFFWGPLVMHGMLTAFRTKALKEVGEFAERHLIEDYEITARLKAKGWSVKSVINSHAWTFVPEHFSTLWRQRTRWSYGGITVVNSVKNLLSVLQDLIGHGMFWATVITIDILVIGLMLKSGGGMSPEIPYWIIALSFMQFAIWYVFQLWMMRMYREKDAYDWLIRATLLPEFIYANVLTFVLVGSYCFLFFNTLSRRARQRGTAGVQRFVGSVSRAFRVFGYAEGWGTRTH